MVFSSEIFLFAFLPVVLALYFAARGMAMRNAVLLVMSLIFYGWGEPKYVLLILGLAFVNYCLGLLIARTVSPRGRRGAVALAVVADVGALAFFKYTNFFVDNVNYVLGATIGGSFAVSQVYLPLGISFFTFHALSYVIDVYRGKATAQPSFGRLALYFAFFPQLIAGPIIRYHDVAQQLASRIVTAEDFAEGVRRFVIGLGKKVLVADTLAAPVDRIFAIAPAELSAPVAWLAIAAYTLQIYFDFSGYSDMAIGLARMFGFRFLENFNFPYVARSIQEFWRRWNISLSNFFRDYLYIPLGGNRCPPWRVYLNLVTVFVLCGFWHGAKWNFIVWGLYHGLFLILERVGVIDALVKERWTVVRHAYAIVVITISWVFFRAETLPYAVGFIGTLAGLSHADPALHPVAFFFGTESWAALAFGVLASTPLTAQAGARWQPLVRATAAVALPLAFIVSTMKLASGTYSPFIYFRF